jgi:CheY-like chemotaxis protein/HPt (histidine-containing phosphotransfer) domain-containing protein
MDQPPRSPQDPEAPGAPPEAMGAREAAFLANLSHELLTPLHGVLGMLTLTLRTGLTDEQRGYLENAHGSAQALHEFLSDLLELSRIDMGRLEPESVVFPLRAMVERVAGPFAARASRKGLAFEQRVAAGCPDELVGDPWRLGHILSKLLSNAVRFTERGGISLAVSGRTIPGGKVELSFTLSDSGVGIDPRQIPALFDPFAQGDGSVTRRFGGAGLGLAICHQQAERMGACLGVESVPGKGSTFKLVLRLPTAPAAATAVPAPVSVPHRVLLAEDNPVNAMLVVRLLEAAGHTLVTAENGREALARLAEGRFDVVLMDLQMPIMGGIEAIERIRATERAAGGHVRIVALTAQAVQGDRERCLAAGADAYLAKPFSVGALEAMVVGAPAPAPRGGSGAEQDGGAPFESCRSCRNQGYERCERRLHRAPLELARALEMCGDDEGLRRDVAAELLRGLPAERVALEVAVAGGQAAAVARAAHKVKSALAAVGAIPASESAAVLEQAARQDDPRLAGIFERFSCELERAVAALERSLRGEAVA